MLYAVKTAGAGFKAVLPAGAPGWCKEVFNRARIRLVLSRYIPSKIPSILVTTDDYPYKLQTLRLPIVAKDIVFYVKISLYLANGRACIARYHKFVIL